MTPLDPTDPDVSRLCLSDGPEVAALRFWIYLPFGILVLVLRLVVLAGFVGLGAVLPRRWKPVAFRCLRRSLGVVVRVEPSRSEVVRLTNRCVVASNHVSMFDTLVALDLGRPTFLSGTALRRESALSPHVFRLLELVSGASFVSHGDKRGLARVLRGWKDGVSDGCLYVTAEMTIDNGRGLFRFHPTLLDRGVPVVPMAIRVRTALGLVAHPFFSGGLATLARLSMSPRVTFDLAYLPALARSEEESPQDFADRVQRAVAAHLGIPATRYTVEDKRAYREALRERRRST